MQKPRALSRIDIRRRLDKPTNSAVLEYTGRGLTFHDGVYGYGDGVFLVVSYTEMPFPPKLRALSEELGVPIESLDVAKDLKSAAVDALIAEGMVKAPQMLAEFAEPVTIWHSWDVRELERRHVVALSRLVELESLAERELRLRARSAAPTIVAAPTEPVELLTEPTFEPEPEPEPIIPASQPVEPADATVAKVQMAVTKAREAELAQRLPNGARRALQKLVRAQYVIRGSDAPSVRGSLVEAMQDAEAMASGMRKTGSCDVEVTVVDWDGEWPVVVRRYGEGGRTIYRVEEALRRAGEAAA
jgi:hypothetical protein